MTKEKKTKHTLIHCCMYSICEIHEKINETKKLNFFYTHIQRWKKIHYFFFWVDGNFSVYSDLIQIHKKYNKFWKFTPHNEK